MKVVRHRNGYSCQQLLWKIKLDWEGDEDFPATFEIFDLQIYGSILADQYVKPV